MSSMVDLLFRGGGLGLSCGLCGTAPTRTTKRTISTIRHGPVTLRPRERGVWRRLDAPRACDKSDGGKRTGSAAQNLEERARSNVAIFSQGILRLDMRARQEVALIGSKILKLDARAREDSRKLDVQAREMVKRTGRIAMGQGLQEHWNDGALDAEAEFSGRGGRSVSHRGVFNKQAAIGALAVMIVLGLQVCSEAWAGTEVAQINVNSGLLDLGDLSDIQSGFASAFLLIFFSEIGDKTFFIAALLASRKSSVAVFSGTFGALTAMTVISVTLGRAFHYIDGILPSFGDTKLPVDDIAAVILLLYFGVSTLIDAANMDDADSGEEQQEAELAIANVGAGGAVAGTVAATFALVFVAEWGDKSFFSTIALAAASSPLGVVGGAIAGHGAATLLAVLGGSFLGNYVSEKVIAYVGGVLFLVFAGATLVEILY